MRAPALARDAGSDQRARAHCLEPHDLILAKCVVGRDRDWEFADHALAAGVVELQTLLDRAAGLPVSDAQRAMIRNRLRALDPRAATCRPSHGGSGSRVRYLEAMTDATKVTEEEVYEALEEVIDPELGLDFVSLGLVYDVEIENAAEVYVTFTLTTPACPIGPQVSEQMKEFVGDIDGVTAVYPKMIFDPPWSPEMMSEDAKFALGF